MIKQNSTTLGCKNKGIRKLEFVAKTQFVSAKLLVERARGSSSFDIGILLHFFQTVLQKEDLGKHIKFFLDLPCGRS